MGEQFQIAAPLAKRALKYKGMLGVILFNTTPHNLVSLLLVPTKSAQQPASPAATAAQTKPQIGSSSLDATCPSPSPSAAAIAVGHPQQHAGSGAKRDPWDIFCTLPVKIHALIFANLDDLADLTCVGATEPYLWGITQEIVQQRYSSLFGSWAGEKIVCAGDKSNPGDYPPGLYSAEEEEDLKKRFLVRMYDSADDFDSDDDYENRNSNYNYVEDGGEPLTLYSLSRGPDTRINKGIRISNKSMTLYWKCYMRFGSGRNGYSASPKVTAKEREICVYRSPFVPMDQAWILRNLTTKDFVTSSGIALDAKFIDGPFIDGIGFGEVVVLRTCWSSSASISMRFKQQIHRGVWAGHRFDITTRGQHDESTKDEEGEWKDVSEEVAAEVAAIWESEYGSSWREVISQMAEKAPLCM